MADAPQLCALCEDIPAVAKPHGVPVCQPCGARAFVSAIWQWAEREWERHDAPPPEPR